MSRTNARRKNRLTTPIYREERPEWLNVNEDEVKSIITNLVNKKRSLSEIGIILRDDHGIPDIKLITGKNLKKTIEEDCGIRIDFPEDLRDLITRALNPSFRVLPTTGSTNQIGKLCPGFL